MNNLDQIPSPFYRYSPWHNEEYLLSLSRGTKLPDFCFFPKSGIPQPDPDTYFDYRIDLILEAESALRGMIGTMVDFHQTQKMAHFLLYYCDKLEITYAKNTGKLTECRFQIDFSDRISFHYSTKICGCVVFLDGKQDSFHHITPQAIYAMRCMLDEIWQKIRELPVWESAKQTDADIRLHRKRIVP